LGIGIRRKNPGREQVIHESAGGALGLHNPEVIENVENTARVIFRPIEVQDTPAHRPPQTLVGFPQLHRIKSSKRHADSFASYWIDIPPNRSCSQFVCFANRCAAAHERVKNHNMAEILLLIELCRKGRALREHAS
jgi:hypothetical protein